MALRAATSRIHGLYRSRAKMEGFIGRSSRYFSIDEKGRIFREEERAKEAIYIQKMERERLEKLRRKSEKDKAAETGDKKAEEPMKG